MRARQALGATVLGLVLACAGVATANAAEFRIGVAAPLSGPDAVFGDQIKLGVERAVRDINATGGFLGHPGRVIARDDGNDPKRATDVANLFVGEKTPAVIGDLSSAATVAGSAVYAPAGVIDIAPAALSPSVTDRGLATVFRMCGRDDEQGVIAARYLQARHIARVAIVHDRTSAGKALADSLRTELGRAGIREVYYGSVESGARDDAVVVSRIKGASAQVVFFGGLAADGGLLAHQLREANAHVTLMGGTSLASDDFAAAAGVAADGTLMVFPQDPKTLATAGDLLRKLRVGGIDPDAYVFYSYAAVQVLKQASDAAASLEPSKIAATMHDGRSFKTVLGDIAFDAKGDPTTSDYTVYVWHKGVSGHMTFDDKAKS